MPRPELIAFLRKVQEQGEKEGIEFPKRVRQVLRLAQEGYSENITMDVVRTTLTKLEERRCWS